MTEAQLATVVAKIVRQLSKGQPKSKSKSTKATNVVTESRSERNERLAVRAFKKAGYGDNVPREDRKPYKGWLSEGLRVKAGEKSVAVGGMRLFHRSQCEAISEG